MQTNQIQTAAYEFLTEPSRLTAVIASCPSDSDTHAATVYYYLDDDFNFYFLTAANTQKYLNLLDNPNAAIVVGFGPGYTSVQGQGLAILLDKDSAEEREAIAQIKKRLQYHKDETWPVFQIDTYERESIAVFKFIPDRLQLMNLERDNGLPITNEETLQIL